MIGERCSLTRFRSDYCHITAPIAGRVGLRLVDPGNVVQSAGTVTLAVITQLQPITVIFTIPEDSLGPVAARLQQESEAAGRRLRSHRPDEDRKRNVVDARQPDRHHNRDRKSAIHLRQQERCAFPQPVRKHSAAGEYAAGSDAGSRIGDSTERPASFVYVIQNDVAHMRSVKPGVTDGGLTQVDGINPGDVVANSSFDKLQDNVAVAVAKPGANPPAVRNPAETAAAATSGSSAP